jgi:aspartyl-tRNA(Asn)/glutamyl-tRNA(Gln) amidotransferase subunit C
MNITRDVLDKIAHLARLEIQEQDADKVMQDMTEIINWVEKLKEVNTDGVEPLTTMSHEINALREDVVAPHLNHESALRAAPAKDDDFFRVPKVLD